MVEITYSNETVQYINLANKHSGAHIIDCISEDDRIVFVVEKGELGIAIGTKAKKLEKLRTLFKKNIKFVEFDEDKNRFIQNLCKPYDIKNIDIEGSEPECIAKIEVNPKDKSKLIGKGGRNIDIIRKLAKRHHSIKDVQVK